MTGRRQEASSEEPPSFPLTPASRGWQARRFSILNEVLGPDFHGPSSSHTAAPQLIALTAHLVVGGVPETATVILFNSFATTGTGHRTQIAVVAGLLGLATTDPRTPEAVRIAAEFGLQAVFEERISATEHPNTIVLSVGRGEVSCRIKGISIGGGNYEIVEQRRIVLTHSQLVGGPGWRGVGDE